MKMKMKMVLMAGALALSMAGQASAAIVSGTTGSSSLVLSIWDANTSFVTTVGSYNFGTFAAGVTGTNTALTASSTGIGSLNIAADAALTAYMSTVNMATAVWNVTAVDTNGTTAFMQTGMVTTTNANPKSAANSIASSQLNAGIIAATDLYDGYYSSVGATTPATFLNTDTAYAGTAVGTDANTFLKFNNTAAIGSSMNFWFLTPSSTLSASKASVAQFKGAGGANSTWTLASNGNLAYAAPVAAIPEPGEWLLILSGLGLIGFIATRRKNEGSMTFA